jgi:hypothetical protein
MIKIIKGVYGWRRLDANSGAFSVDPKEEARLVKLGVAEYVTAPAPSKAEQGAETKAKPMTAGKPKKAKVAKKK